MYALYVEASRFPERNTSVELCSDETRSLGLCQALYLYAPHKS